MFLAEIPWVPLAIAACVAIAIGGAIGLNIMLKTLRELRHNVAAELKNEIAAQREAKPVAVQQPLIVAEEKAFTPLEKHEELTARVDELGEEQRHLTHFDDHAALARRLDDELGRERSARKKIHEEIAVMQGDLKALARETVGQSATLAELKADTKANASKVDGMGGTLGLLNQNVQNLSTSVTNFLRDEANRGRSDS